MTFLLAGWLAAYGGDAVSTHAALNRGAHELLLTQNPWVDDGLVAGEAAVTWWALHRLHRTHPKLAVSLGLGAVALRGFVIVHNVRT